MSEVYKNPKAADGCWPQNSTRATHYLDRSKRPPEVLCGHAMTREEHLERIRLDPAQVTCRDCRDRLTRAVNASGS